MEGQINWESIEKYREKAGITQRELGVLLGHGKSYISQLKSRGDALPRLEALAMCGILGCSPEHIEIKQEKLAEDKGEVPNEIKYIAHKCDALEKQVRSIADCMDDLRVEADGIRKLLSGRGGIAVMNEKLSELQEQVNVIGDREDDFKAERLILKMLQEGLVEEQTVINKASELNISRQEVQRARNRLGLIAITKGYGSNKKKYYELRRG